MQLKQYKSIKGISLIESVISIAIMLFIMTTFSLVISSTITTSTLADKKVRLTDALDERIDEYAILGTFNTSSSGSMTFSQFDVEEDPDLIKFEANNTDFNLQVSREVSKIS
ncbi:hypothetical protein LO80_04575 [Candidatus Francisella endociliophora]|uniref:Type II secretion system protein n=1 Tax=Candidatus Francisella endociliophora TaxID=653937 RepID=A0A097EP23_9GAMM|nr:hypothetical protein [Francisella sp. FSC1006]AIT09313.1 hypothetical protein LO80_04575 [Francisella sp. FSC1006]